MADTKESPVVVTIAIPVTFTARDICSLFVNCFEGGYSPWILGYELLSSDYTPLPNVVDYGQDELYEGNYQMALTVENPDEGPDELKKIIGPEDVKRGLEIMGQKYLRNLQRIINEEDDALDADVFVQCVVYGEAHFG